MVNLSNVTHTSVWGGLIDKYSSTVTSVVETDIDESMGIEGMIY